MQDLKEEIKTPYYYYNIDKILKNVKAFEKLTDGDVRILYATMANDRPEVLMAIKKAGIGVFVNSISHLKASIKAGIDPGDIVFAGSGHDNTILKEIASLEINYHADSLEQLKSYIKYNPKGSVGLRVNVGSLLQNNDIDPAPRLGMTIEEIDLAIKEVSQNISIMHTYVGTNLLSADMHNKCLKALYRLAKNYDSISDIDLGGGFAFSPSNFEDSGMWSTVLRDWYELSKGKKQIKLTIEPGRSIVRTAGKYFVTVTDIKKRNENIFATVDSSGTWFPRKIVHNIDDNIVSVIGKENIKKSIKTYICGCTTYSKDFLSICLLPEISVGDVICFEAAGAYNEAMHLDFLGMPRPGIVISENNINTIIRKTERV